MFAIGATHGTLSTDQLWLTVAAHDGIDAQMAAALAHMAVGTFALARVADQIKTDRTLAGAALAGTLAAGHTFDATVDTILFLADRTTLCAVRSRDQL